MISNEEKDTTQLKPRTSGSLVQHFTTEPEYCHGYKLIMHYLGVGGGLPFDFIWVHGLQIKTHFKGLFRQAFVHGFFKKIADFFAFFLQAQVGKIFQCKSNTFITD